MSDKSQQEPSIEEILASIRRIISDDAEPGKPTEAGGAAAEDREASAASAAPDDVLELTDVVEEDPAPAPAPPPPPRPSRPAEVQLDLAPEPEPEFNPPPPPRREPDSPAVAAGAGLLSAASAAAAASSLSRLATKRPDSLGQMPVGTRTVEDLVMELLRPMLREWVDDNLPHLVEQLVERELRRLSNTL